MRYFVTGATGFVGGRVARQLREAGHDVVAVVRTPTKATDLLKLGVTVVQGDVTDKASMKAPMTGVDGIFHIAGWYKVGAGRTAGAEGQAINVDGTRSVLELMEELGIPRGVYTSTLAINSDTHGKEVDESYHFTGKHLSEYDRTKAEAHAVAEQFVAKGLPLVVLMPGLIYGPGDTSSVRTTLVQYLQRKLPAIPQRTAYSWAHVDDIAGIHIKAMEESKPRETYIVAGPTYTLVEALQIAQEITGIPAPACTAAEPVWHHGQRGRLGGAPGQVTRSVHQRGAARAGGSHVYWERGKSQTRAGLQPAATARGAARDIGARDEAAGD